MSPLVFSGFGKTPATKEQAEQPTVAAGNIPPVVIAFVFLIGGYLLLRMVTKD